MSGAIDPMLGGISAAYTLLGAQSTNLQAEVTTLTEQVATGLVSTQFGGLGSATAPVIGLDASLSQNQAVLGGISQADATLSLTQATLGQLGAIAASFVSQVGQITNADPSSVSTVASAAQAALQQVASILDSQNGGVYLFSGTEGATPPVPNPDQILTSGFTTQIAASVAALGTAGGPATIAATQAIAESNAAGTSPFSANLSQPAAALQSQLQQVAIGGGQWVTIGVVASANTVAVSAGPSTTGSYTRDLMRALATLGALTPGQVNDSGFQALLQDTLGTLQGVVGGVADEQGGLGGRQNVIDQAGTLIGSVNDALTSQIGGLQDVNVAQVSTQLAQTQASLQASFKMMADLPSDSLLNYLPVP